VVAAIEVPRAGRRYGRERLAARLLGELARIGLEPEVIESAAQLEPAALSSLDAIHLASAVIFRHELEAFVAYDERLVAAAQAAGLEVRSPA
jgi:uncharacterized protein